MADIYSPWMASEEEDVTTQGLVTPEFMEMYAEAQDGPGAEAELDMETTPEIDTFEDSATGGEQNGAMMQYMGNALATMQQQADVISKLMNLLTNN